MATTMFIVIIALILFHLVLTCITDDKRVFESLTKKQLYKLTLVKDTIAAIIIIVFALLPFIG